MGLGIPSVHNSQATNTLSGRIGPRDATWPWWCGYILLLFEGGLARLPVRHPLEALDGGLTGGCSGNSSILGSRCLKADSYH